MPAPPPNGVSSTTRPLSVVWSRGLSVRSSCPAASAFCTWRCPRNHPNQSGNRVTTSSCTEEPRVHFDAPGLEVDALDRVLDQRDEDDGVELEDFARGQRNQTNDVTEGVRAVGDVAALEVLREVLVVLELGILDLDLELATAQSLR